MSFRVYVDNFLLQRFCTSYDLLGEVDVFEYMVHLRELWVEDMVSFK